MSNAARAIAFLRDRFEGVAGDILLTALSEPKEADVGRPREYRLKRPVDLALVSQIIAKEDKPNRALFFCVGTLKPDAVKTAKGFWRAKSNIWQLPGLHVDVDFKHLALPASVNPIAEVTRHVTRSPWKPAPLVITGGGVHAYWKTAQPIERDDFEQAEAVMKALARHFSGDPQVAEVSRLMRLPGTSNWKYGEPRRCLVSLHGEAAIDIWDEEVGAGEPLFEQCITARAGAPAPPVNAFEAYANLHQPPIDPGGRLAEMDWHGAGESGVHATQLSVTAALLNAGVTRDEVVEQVLSATLAKPFAQAWDARAERRTITGMVDSFVAKLVAEGRQAPNGPGHVNGNISGAGSGATQPAQQPPGKTSSTGLGSCAPLPFINIGNWDQNYPPPQEWAVREVVPTRQPTLFSGAGGEGKSILELQLVVGHVLGRNWLDFMPEPGPAIYLSAEDDEDGLQRRLHAIAAAHEARYADLTQGGLHLLSYAGEDCQLAVSSRRTGLLEPTPLFTRLYEATCDIKPKHIGLDTSADVFGGNEIDRVQVRQFCGLLRKLAMAANGAVVLLAHPSLTGISTGTGISGSTAWHNSVRARMYLKSLDDKKSEEAGDGDDDDDSAAATLRRLEFKKNQYGEPHKSIVLRFHQGMFLPVDAAGDSYLHKQQVEQQFLALLRRIIAQGRNVSAEKSRTYAPAVLAEQPDARFGAREFARAMERLLERKTICFIVEGPPSRRRGRLIEGEPT